MQIPCTKDQICMDETLLSVGDNSEGVFLRDITMYCVAFNSVQQHGHSPSCLGQTQSEGDRHLNLTLHQQATRKLSYQNQHLMIIPGTCIAIPTLGN